MEEVKTGTWNLEMTIGQRAREWAWNMGLGILLQLRLFLSGEENTTTKASGGLRD